MELTVSPSYNQLVSDIEEAYHRGDMPALEKIVLAYRGSEQALYVSSDSRVTKLIPRIRRSYCEYETREEQRLRAKLVESHAPLIAGSEPIERTYKYVPLEAQLAGIHDGVRYCHVGSGPLPETLLAMRNYSPLASLTGIDADPEMLRLGKELADAAWPGNAISFYTAYGDDIDYRGYTHVHVAVLVRPELNVVKCVCDTADRDVTIMLRTVEGLGGLLYEPVARETELFLLEQGFQRIGIVRGHAIMNTHIYKR
jgi:hypothetical protein